MQLGMRSLVPEIWRHRKALSDVRTKTAVASANDRVDDLYVNRPTSDLPMERLAPAGGRASITAASATFAWRSHGTDNRGAGRFLTCVEGYPGAGDRALRSTQCERHLPLLSSVCWPPRWLLRHSRPTTRR